MKIIMNVSAVVLLLMIGLLGAEVFDVGLVKNWFAFFFLFVLNTFVLYASGKILEEEDRAEEKGEMQSD